MIFEEHNLIDAFMVKMKRMLWLGICSNLPLKHGGPWEKEEAWVGWTEWGRKDANARRVTKIVVAW
jgi:hypothetical protein